MTQTATPTGMCWCDCGRKAAPGAFFLPGHDKRALTLLDSLTSAPTVAERLAASGYIPGKKSLAEDVLKAHPLFEMCGLPNNNGQPCRAVYARGRHLHRHRADITQHQIGGTA